MIKCSCGYLNCLIDENLFDKLDKLGACSATNRFLYYIHWPSGL